MGTCCTQKESRGGPRGYLEEKYEDSLFRPELTLDEKASKPQENSAEVTYLEQSKNIISPKSEINVRRVT